MNVYRQLTTAYRQLAARPPHWTQQLDNLGTLDTIVTTIANDRPDPTHSDIALRRLIELAARYPDALTIALHALGPRMRRSLGRAATSGYRNDALANLAVVLLDSGLTDPRLAHLARRAVNRAHTRTHKAAARVHHRGVTNDYTVAPIDPDRLALIGDGQHPDIADAVCDALALDRFAAAIRTAIDNGIVTAEAWASYRDQRLARAIDPTVHARTSTERKAATRAARRIQPIIDQCLHAA